MQPYNPEAPSRADALVKSLRGRQDPLFRAAADEIERLRRLEFRLARRIHQQRYALRENWMIVEQRSSHRRAWRQSPLLSQILRTRRRQRLPELLERWYGDGCPPWAWPTTFMVFVVALMLTTAILS